MNCAQFESCTNVDRFPTTISKLLARVIMTFNLWKYYERIEINTYFISMSQNELRIQLTFGSFTKSDLVLLDRTVETIIIGFS